jgi:CoA:oxalate CoA-transferase
LRNENYEELRPIIAQEIAKKKTEEWKEILIEADIPSGPINNIEMVVNDEQVKYRNMIQEVQHPKVGRVKMAGIPIKINECSDSIRFSPPMLGQHNEEVLKEVLCYSEDYIKELRENNVI